MKHLIILLFSFFMFSFTSAQDDHDHNDHGHHHPHLQVGLQAQQYPTGFIFSLAADNIWNHHYLIEVRIGYNTFDHKDLGEQDQEEGSGFGGSIGYKYYLNHDLTKWHFGFRTDVWFNEVDWVMESDIIGMPDVGGSSDIIVLQPTVLAGYSIPIKEVLAVTPEVAFGVEWNVDTDGAPTGEGPILLWGVTFAHRFGE